MSRLDRLLADELAGYLLVACRRCAILIPVEARFCPMCGERR